MNALLDDRAVAARVLAHVEKRSTDLGETVWREPVENYRSEARLQAEMALLRRLPVPFCPAAALGGEGAFVARPAAGVPIVAVRGRDGQVRAFRNACRHRGMPVADGRGCTKTFVCRYHGWGYGLDGSLRHVPHEEGFPGLDRGSHGLVPVHAEERSGLVFVTQDGAEEAPADLPPILAPGQMLFDSAEREVAANWKIFAESFLEGYHIRPTHRESFYPYGFDNLNVIEAFGRNSRVTFPFRRIARLAEVPEAERRIDGLLTYVYHLFPNVLVAVLSRHTMVVVLEPLSTDRTRMVTYGLTNPPAEGEDDEPERLRAEAARDAAFADIGGQEDRDVTCAIQRGLSSGANDHFTFGRFEGAIVHFHRVLDAALMG
ncbi:aromatic ring-hydroxylating dioxygenase subunit alpha [Marinibaculum pumilum]|uniref:Aromatic ring-hydroxylating dioxygenase subunit alpha n=1 Tax=Marinibaculum pumilum TaxID=1766165 RepID=A0ABV7KTT0_9PROT